MQTNHSNRQLAIPYQNMSRFFRARPKTCGPEAADGPASGGSIPRHSNRSSVRAAEEAVRLALRGVPRNRRRRGTVGIAFRAGASATFCFRAVVLRLEMRFVRGPRLEMRFVRGCFGWKCASCGGFGRNLLSCGLSALTKRKSGRIRRTKRNPCQNPSHETQIRPREARTKRKSDRGRHAPNAIPAEGHARKRGGPSIGSTLVWLVFRHYCVAVACVPPD